LYMYELKWNRRLNSSALRSNFVFQYLEYSKYSNDLWRENKEANEVNRHSEAKYGFLGSISKKLR